VGKGAAAGAAGGGVSLTKDSSTAEDVMSALAAKG